MRQFRLRLSGWMAAGLLLGGLMAWAVAVSPAPTAAQGPAGQRLFGPDNGRSSTIEIDTATGRARLVGATGWNSGASGMATAFQTVFGPAGRRFAAGTFFGVLGDNGNGNDYVVVVDPVSGQAEKIVQTSVNLGGRGIAFGPDGRTIYAVNANELVRIEVATGQLTKIGDITDDRGRVYSSDNLEWDPDTRRFVSLLSGSGGSSEVAFINPSSAEATIISSVNLDSCTIIRAPNPVPGPGGVDWPAGTWFAIVGGDLVTINIDVSRNFAALGTRIGPLGPESSGSVCGTAFTLPQAPPTPTVEPTATLISDGPGCICRAVLNRVPRAVINRAIANPELVQGWRELLDPNKPASPVNPRRECLDLRSSDLDYHWLFNSPLWRVGCR